jgi:hypothetical protein
MFSHVVETHHIVPCMPHWPQTMFSHLVENPPQILLEVKDKLSHTLGDYFLFFVYTGFEADNHLFLCAALILLFVHLLGHIMTVIFERFPPNAPSP